MAMTTPTNPYPEVGSYARINDDSDYGYPTGTIVRVVNNVKKGGTLQVELVEPRIHGRDDIHFRDLTPLTSEELGAYFIRDTLSSARSYDRLLKVTYNTATHLHAEYGLSFKGYADSDTDNTLAEFTRIDGSPLDVMLDSITSVTYDHEAEAERTERRRAQEAREVADAYKVISHSLNVMGRDTEGPLLEALRSEHSTLLGKLANVVLAAVGERERDERVKLLNMTLGDIIHKTGYDEHTRVTDLRQPLL